MSSCCPSLLLPQPGTALFPHSTRALSLESPQNLQELSQVLPALGGRAGLGRAERPHEGCEWETPSAGISLWRPVHCRSPSWCSECTDLGLARQDSLGARLCQELMTTPGMLGPPEPRGTRYPGSSTQDVLAGMMDLGPAPVPGCCSHRVRTVPALVTLPIHSQVLPDVPSLPEAEQHLRPLPVHLPAHPAAPDQVSPTSTPRRDGSSSHSNSLIRGK